MQRRPRRTFLRQVLPLGSWTAGSILCWLPGVAQFTRHFRNDPSSTKTSKTRAISETWRSCFGNESDGR
uniref:Secreted protein n=1 Tax=Peronospora matthiolae TaxID=2874970 RepID=A0AAV1TRI3_9STRA